MPLPVLAVLPFLAGLLARFFESTVARTIALKIILTALLMVTLPIVLNNLFYKILQKLMENASTRGGDAVNSVTVQLTGLAAFFASHLRLADMVSIILSALVVKVSLRMIPFIRVVN